jgi:hypothetical protein
MLELLNLINFLKVMNAKESGVSPLSRRERGGKFQEFLEILVFGRNGNFVSAKSN